MLLFNNKMIRGKKYLNVQKKFAFCKLERE